MPPHIVGSQPVPNLSILGGESTLQTIAQVGGVSLSGHMSIVYNSDSAFQQSFLA